MAILEERFFTWGRDLTTTAKRRRLIKGHSRSWANSSSTQHLLRADQNLDCTHATKPEPPLERSRCSRTISPPPSVCLHQTVTKPSLFSSPLLEERPGRGGCLLSHCKAPRNTHYRVTNKFITWPRWNSSPPWRRGPGRGGRRLETSFVAILALTNGPQKRAITTLRRRSVAPL